MSLSPDQIKALLTTSQRKKRKSKDAIDPNIRTYQTWFKLHPRAFGGEPGSPNLDEHPQCSNPNCTDDRPPKKTKMGELVKIQFTIEVNGIRMCRRCFLAGYGLPDEAQLTL